MAKREKTLEYRRARFLDSEQNLEKCVRAAWDKFKTQKARTITGSGGLSTTGLSMQDLGKSGFYLHCGRYTAGQAVGTIQTQPAPDVKIGEQLPKPGEDFLSSDFMALFQNNHVICMSCGRNASSLQNYLKELFCNASFEDACHKFNLIRIMHPDKAAAIARHHVKSIDLKMGLKAATMMVANEAPDGGTRYQKIQKGMVELWNAVSDKDENITKIQDDEKSTIMVSINIPDSAIITSKEGVEKLSKEIVEDEESEGYTIHLRNGEKIKLDEISVRKKVKLKADANSVSVFEAWNAMQVYIRELEADGILEV